MEKRWGEVFGLGMKQKWVIKVACKKSIDTQTKNTYWLISSILHRPNPRLLLYQNLRQLHDLIQLLFSKWWKKLANKTSHRVCCTKVLTQSFLSYCKEGGGPTQWYMVAIQPMDVKRFETMALSLEGRRGKEGPTKLMMFKGFNHRTMVIRVF